MSIGEKISTSVAEVLLGLLVGGLAVPVVWLIIRILRLIRPPGIALGLHWLMFLDGITATMPVTIPLALWIVYSGSSGDRATVLQFIEALFVTMVANLFFVLAMWLAAQSRWRLVPLLIVGYSVWGVVLGLITGVRHVLDR